jgi:uncharacterized repeat protein (TIGR03803 family)
MREARMTLRAALAPVLIVSGVLALPHAAAAPTLTTIWSFTGTGGDGEYPFGRLVFDSSGAMYGTTEGGGTSYNGTVFKLTPPAGSGGAWTESVLYRFAGGSDGRQPSTGVMFGSNGDLYGTTYNGGNTNCGGGCGTVFQLAPPAGGGAWTHSLVYSFAASTDGATPGEVVFGPNGALFGITAAGGATSTTCRRIGCGTVFELTQAKNGTWSKTILHSFPAYTHDGYHPNTDIAVDGNGNLYGTTVSGGNSNYGTVFMLSPPAGGGAWTETVLYSFSGGSDGGYPIGGVVVGSNGVLYGTASYSGVANDSGTAFQLTPPASGGAWTFKVLHTFAGGKDGATPASTLVLDSSGNLYGSTYNGGSSACYQGCGTIFMLSPPTGGGAWTETVLVDLGNSGQNPNASTVAFRNGVLYGTTYDLGAANVGSAFDLVP